MCVESDKCLCSVPDIKLVVKDKFRPFQPDILKISSAPKYEVLVNPEGFTFIY